MTSSSDRVIAVIGTGDKPTGLDAPPEPIQAAVAPGVKSILIEPAPGIFPGSPSARLDTIKAYVEAGLSAVNAGADALYINTMGDYGLKELRQQVSVPVIGAGEAAIETAMTTASSFAIVTIWPRRLSFIYEHVLVDSSAQSKCTDIIFLSQDSDLDTLHQTNNFVTEMQACTVTSLSAIREACDSCIENGAQCIILGCTCMQAVANSLISEVQVPLIEPMVNGYLTTQASLAV